MTLAELANKLGYCREHVYRLHRGRLPITENFYARCISRLGPWARHLFWDGAAVATDTASDVADRAGNLPLEPPGGTGVEGKS